VDGNFNCHFCEVWYGAQAIGANASHEISHMRRRYSALLVTNKSKKKKPGDNRHKSKGKSGDYGKGNNRVKDNPGKGKSGETSDPHATKRKCLFFMKKELWPVWGKTHMACGGKNHFQMSSKCKHHVQHPLCW